MRGARRWCQPDPGTARPPKLMGSGPGGPQGNPTSPHRTPPPKQLQRQAPATVPTWVTPQNRPPAEGRGTPPGRADDGPHPAPRTPAPRSTGQPATPPVLPQTAPDPKLDPQPTRPAPHCQPHTNGQAHPARQQNAPPPTPAGGTQHPHQAPGRGGGPRRGKGSREGRGEGGGRGKGRRGARGGGRRSPPTPHHQWRKQPPRVDWPCRPRPREHKETPPPPRTQGKQSRRTRPPGENRPAPRSPTEPGSRPGFKGERVHLTHA
ncbi:splicing factor, proline- and glutamine-rich-like [Epinephelus fuscoguttatus]|uniref:splicing factor, proline- and glutamine-rich-like n=1 Tax=Epinephelus fuscoguttatus TaxID=293821 RepID=UPI0020D1AE7B|nr:splicing factor, proline- and glutamine-rich-like [Epinephelus fuscoguttatus]